MKLGADSFDFKGQDYLIVADYCSEYPGLHGEGQDSWHSCPHVNQSSVDMVSLMKLCLTTCLSQTMSFCNFAEYWCIKLTMSSPRYAKPNGISERVAQMVKKLMKKATEDGRDRYIALLESEMPFGHLKKSWDSAVRRVWAWRDCCMEVEKVTEFWEFLEQSCLCRIQKHPSLICTTLWLSCWWAGSSRAKLPTAGVLLKSEVGTTAIADSWEGIKCSKKVDYDRDTRPLPTPRTGQMTRIRPR